jgi:hypothetical protein
MKFPCTLYLKQRDGRILRIEASGETVRSWVALYRPKRKYSKKEYALASESECEEEEWASRNFRMIQRALGEYTPKVIPAVLRRVAEVIGYEEKREER